MILQFQPEILTPEMCSEGDYSTGVEMLAINNNLDVKFKVLIVIISYGNQEGVSLLQPQMYLEEGYSTADNIDDLDTKISD